MTSASNQSPPRRWFQFRLRTLSIAVAVLVPHAFANTASAQHIVGDLVVVVRPTQKKIGNCVVGTIRTDTLFAVQGAQGNWVWCDQGVPGWVHARHVRIVGKWGVDVGTLQEGIPVPIR